MIGMINTLKTLIISRGYPTEKYPLHGIFEFDQAKAIANAGQDVIFASIDMRSIRRWRKWGIEKFTKEGILVYGINIPLGRVPKVMLRFFTILGLKILYKKIEREQGIPNILHAHFTGSAYSAAKLKQMTGIPLVVTEHSSQINKENINKDTYKIANVSYKIADKLITVSPALGERIKEQFNTDYVYIPNIIDLKAFNYRSRSNDKRFNFISTGNLIDSKNMDLTIEAFNDAFSKKPEVTLTIFGQGPKRKVLENIISRYGLDSRIKLMGLCPRANIAKKLESSDCFVLPSKSETFGVAYIEAMAMGVPVIATKCGGPESFVNERNGIIIDVDSKEQLVQAMKYMYNNIGKYDREGIAKETVEKFSPKTVAKRIIDVYEKVLSKYTKKLIC